MPSDSLIHLRRDLILREVSFAQLVLGTVASAVVPALTVLLLLTAGKQPLLGWGTIWQWLVMTAGGAAATPVVLLCSIGATTRSVTSREPKPVSVPTGKSGGAVCNAMLIFDELKRNDPQLRLLAVMLAGGLFVLLAGLWWVQVVSARKYESHLETQSYRTVRIPAVRGKILDRDGRVLAENRPRYSLSLYLDDVRTAAVRGCLQQRHRAGA